MRYASIMDLVERVSIDDLAERVSTEEHGVTGDLLGKKIEGGSLSGESATIRGAVELAVERLNQVLDDASADIDGYLGAQLPLPDPLPRTIKVRCVDIAIYRLFGGAGDGEREKIYDGAMAWLRKVGNGDIALTGDDGADADGNDVLVDAGERVFDKDSLAGFTA